MATKKASALDNLWGRADALAGRLAALPWGRRHAVAAILGAVATLALPPIYLMPVLYPAFAGLVWLLPRG
ncbi:MAG: hypothetical protein KAT39_11410, partial [Alphaproteobacteria bacterium]|nr:hypothetical protein [Alphaproteobacteria bacterium]